MIFDKDGTLFDFRQSWGGWAARLLADLAADAAACSAAGRAPSALILDAGAFAADSPVIAATAADIAAALLPHLPGWTAGRADRPDERAGRADADVPRRCRCAACWRRCAARGLRLGVATNDIEAPARAHLAAPGVDGLFDFIAGYDSGHGAKPGPGHVLAFAARDRRLRPPRVADGGRQPP